ncbi:50S ribosomal protein L9 [Buchnera aphidicola (Mollitrichosiphum nigrofasciatum)]|uniref:50S ribosomal protein L9 n=1 Tax=Buchnera aphidicola TaxID=9 RepID=UPI0031B86A66
MNVILLRNVKNLGETGSIVFVKPGFGRNFLIPKGQACLATKKNILNFKIKKKDFIKKEKILYIEANKRCKQLSTLKSMHILVKSSREGKIFGSIGVKDIKNVIQNLGFKIRKHEIFLPNGVLRKIGLHEIIFQPHPDIFNSFKIKVFSK